MTDNKAINEIIKEVCSGCYGSDEEPHRCSTCGFKMAKDALEEIQQYRAIETELREKYHANVDIKMLMQHFIETIFKGEKHEGFRILTNEDAEMWDAYRAIGTVEECRTAVERMKPRKPVIRYGCTFRCPPDYGGEVGDEYGDVYYCPNCDEELHSLDDRCRCGQAIDWNE